MNRETCSKPCELKDGFTLAEKTLARIGFYGLISVGAYAIYSRNPVWCILYLCFALVGNLFVVYSFLCAYCPYPFKYSDCLFFPYQAVSNVVSEREGQITPRKRLGFVLVMAGLVLIPQYWLLSSHILLVLFWILALPLLLAFPFYYCRRCRHERCGFNRARMLLEVEQ